MDWIYAVKIGTMTLCWLNYGLALYRSNWDISNTDNIGWLMAGFGWTNVVL